MAYTPEKGDVIWLDFDPSSGHEIMKRRPAFVISRKIFNQHTGMAIVAPITSTIRGIALEVILPESSATSGSVLVHQLKSLDFGARNAELIEHSSLATINEITSIAKTIIS